MGNFISIRADFPDIDAKLKRLGAEGTKALVRGMNATVVQGKKRMASSISKEFRVTVTEAASRLKVNADTARPGVLHFEASLEATRRLKGRSMNMIAFVEKAVSLNQARLRTNRGEGGKQTLRSGGQVQKALQLRFQVKRTGGKKMIKGAFIANQGRTVFMRTSKGRFPIQALSTIDVPQMFNTTRINEAVRTVLLDRFEKNFNRELRAIVKGFVK